MTVKVSNTSSRSIIVNKKDTDVVVRVPNAVSEIITGPAGPQGPKGDTGTSLSIIGSVDTFANLPEISLVGAGEGYIVEDEGDLYFVNQITEEWYSVGQIIGPPGPQGIQGEKGDDGLTTLTITGVVSGISDDLGNLVTSFEENPTFSGDTTFLGSVDLIQAQLTANLKHVNVTTPFLMDAFDMVEYRSAEYTVQISQDSNYVITKLMVIQNGTDAAVTEYGTTTIGEFIPYTFATNQTNGVLEVLLQCENANIIDVSIKFYRVLYDD